MPEEFKNPGQLIQALLDERGWSQSVLAVVLGVSVAVVNRMIGGTRPIDPPMAILLEQILGQPAERFLALQQAHDLAMARRVAIQDPARATRAVLFGDLPIAEMIRRRWLEAEDVRDVRAIERSLTKFFGVGSVDEIEVLPHAPKRTEATAPVSGAQLAWIYRVRQIASEMLVGRYSPGAVRAAVGKLSSLLSAPEEARKVPRVMAECGIRFVIVETIGAAKIDGVCFWLNDFAPVIGLSLRFDRIDNFWFVLRHECEHVLRRDGQRAAMFDADLDGEHAGTGPAIADEERIANAAAAEFCVPRKQLDAFISRKEPFFKERDILGFSKMLGVHPGIVAGQIRHRTGRYDRLKNHLVRIREAVTSGAMVDGWGDIAPIGE